MALPERKKFDAALPAAVPATPDTDTRDALTEMMRHQPATPDTALSRIDPHYFRRERRDTRVDHVQIGSRMRASLRREMKAFCEEHDETITDFIERSVEYMLTNSKERP